MFLAALAAGCSKDYDDNAYGDRILLFAETVGNNNSKVAFDPATIPSGAEWIAGEPIWLNGNVYNIAFEENACYLKDGLDVPVEPLGVAMKAIYLGASYGGNDVTVSSTEIILNNLVVKFRNDDKQEMAFPMVANAESGANKLYFNHLTGGMKITISKTEGSANVASLKMVAQSTTDEQNMSYGGVTARWAVQGPSVPTGNVGSNPDDVDVKYISEMNFSFMSGSNNYVTVSTTPVSFCVPVTITPIKRLVLTGYASDGTEVFHVSKEFTSPVSPVTVDRNRMYTVPDIVF